MPPQRTRAILQHFTTSLAQFQSSQDQIRILATVSSSLSQQNAQPTFRPASTGVEDLTILDSSFNPPTAAHASMLRSALRATPASTRRRVLLLLSVKNADKEAKPASFPLRLCMMEAFGHEVLKSLSGEEGGDLDIDMGVTTLPYFHDKSAAIASMEGYPSASSSSTTALNNPVMTQTFLAGFDTLIRILTPSYYRPHGMKAALGPFFERARLRVTIREDDKWEGKGEQIGYVKHLESGQLDGIGGVGAWISKVDMVDGEDEGRGVSSSLVREKVGKGLTVEGLVGDEVSKIIKEEGLYEDGN